MTPAMIAAALGFIEAILSEAPTIVADVKKLIAAIEGKSTAAPSGPLAPQVISDTQALDDEMKQL